MNAGEALQHLIGAEIYWVEGTPGSYDSDDCADFRVVTRKGQLVAYATNAGEVSLEWVPLRENGGPGK